MQKQFITATNWNSKQRFVFFFLVFLRRLYRSQNIERKGADMCLPLSEVVRKQANVLKMSNTYKGVC